MIGASWVAGPLLKPYCTCARCCAAVRQWFLYDWGPSLTPGATEPVHTPFASPTRMRG